MNILITGGAGFIGSHLTLRLLAMGHRVTILDSLEPQIHGDDPENTSPLYRSVIGRANFMKGSVCDESAWVGALEGQEAIIHLAAETGTGQSMYEIKRYSDVNIGGTALMLELLANRKHGIGKVLVASSRAVYGEGKYRSRALGIVYPDARKDADMMAGRFEPLCTETGEPLELLATDEESKIHPSSVYGITKYNQEQMVMTVCRSLGVAATAFRYQNVYGPGQSLSNPYTGILSIFSTRILNGSELNIFEDGKESRDFVYIDDVIDATTTALFSKESSDEVFGIGCGTPISVMSVAEALVRHYERQVPIRVSGAYRLGDIRHNYADNGKALRLLGFQPKTNFASGIARFAAWVREQDVQTDTYQFSLDKMKAKGIFKT
jgi:dTDP-L-rhamnose 4-epimerase